MNLIDFQTSLNYVKPFLDGSFIEFGVCTSDSMCQALSHFININNKPNFVFGFDSFEGLPDEKEGVQIPSNWVKGGFALKDHCPRWGGERTKEAGLRYIEQQLQPYRNFDINIKLISGWFKDTLNKDIVKLIKSNKAMFVHIDTDIYISTLEVLDFIFNNNILEDQCLIKYDDWDLRDYNIEMYTAGQSKAHVEMLEKYKPNLTQICDNLYRYNK